MPFTPSNSGQRSPPTYYRGCWHVVSRGFFLWYRPATGMTPPPPRPTEKRFTPRKASSRTRRCSVRLAPIAENSSLLPPVGVWAVLNPSVADHPLRPAPDQSLGEPLPHQPANRPRAPPAASHPRVELCSLSPSRERGSLCGLVGAFAPVFLTAGQMTHVSLTRAPLASPLRGQRVRLACVR